VTEPAAKDDIVFCSECGASGLFRESIEEGKGTDRWLPNKNSDRPSDAADGAT
jgi:hypothetical protein